MSDLVFDAVSVRYRGLTAVDRVSLTVPSGQVVGLVGESGSGKSTLARAAVGLAPLSGGRVLLGGTDVRRLPRRKPLQMVFQDPYSSLDPRMAVGESITEAMPRGAHRGAAGRRAEVARLLDLVNLDPDRAGVLPGQLSGGQRQRVALARALAARQLRGARTGQVRDAEPLEVLVGPRLPRIGHIRPHGHVREEGVFLEDEPDTPLVGPPVDAPRRVEPDVLAERDPPARRSRQTGDRAQHRGLPGSGRPHEGDRPADLER